MASSVQPGLAIEMHHRGTFTLVRLRGRLDTPHETLLARRIGRCLEEGHRRFIVDCSGLDYLSSRGVSAFIGVLDDLRGQEGDLKLIGVTDRGGMVLDRLGVSMLIQRFATLEEAVRAFETPITEYMTDQGLEGFVASPRSKIFHAAHCASARRIRARREFPSRRQARDAGLRPCRTCC